ncbi:GNAT family N-acetyltransferase [Paenibacillus sinopodophylli]|uniref:GNAT family N-acetyltransferase n=1 Tax=Paenibacillus sinopodophylli TaxID=1837342 RepID=UPI00110D1538|nr:GNAT family N-acetyltransferase [Paenibacillus sinopodophylli]
MNHISVQLCGRKCKFIINNLYPLYLHDLAGIRNVLPNKYGVFEEEEQYQTLEQQIPVFDIWWEKEGVLFPYLITVDAVPAGFVFVATPPYVLDHCDFMINEVFILRPFRGKGIGEYAVSEIFNWHRGSWMLYTTPTDNNSKTISFWRKALSRYTNHQFTEEDKELHDVGLNKVFKFNSMKSV